MTVFVYWAVKNRNIKWIGEKDLLSRGLSNKIIIDNSMF